MSSVPIISNHLSKGESLDDYISSVKRSLASSTFEEKVEFWLEDFFKSKEELNRINKIHKELQSGLNFFSKVYDGFPGQGDGTLGYMPSDGEGYIKLYAKQSIEEIKEQQALLESSINRSLSKINGYLDVNKLNLVYEEEFPTISPEPFAMVPIELGAVSKEKQELILGIYRKLVKAIGKPLDGEKITKDLRYLKKCFPVHGDPSTYGGRRRKSRKLRRTRKTRKYRR